MTDLSLSAVASWMRRKPHEFVFFIALVAAFGAAVCL